MAILYSEDNELASTLSLTPITPTKKTTVSEWWQQVSVVLTSGSRSLSLGARMQEKEACLLCRHPEDEAVRLRDMLLDICQGRRDQGLFEPSEPSFELHFERTAEGGIKVYAWLDAGNASTGFYRWDAAGIRFYTSQEHVLSFIADLGHEFLSA